MVLLQRHVSLLSSLWPHGGCAGSYRSPVWRSKSANTGGSVPVPAVAAWGTKSRHQHPRGGTNLPKGWKFHACFLLSYISIQTHLWATGPSLWSFSVSQLMVSLCFFQFQMSQLNIIDSEVFLIFYSWGRRSSWRPRKVSHWRCFRLLPACVSTKASWQQRQHRVTTDQVIEVTQMCAFYFPTEEKLGFSALLL